MGAGRIVCLWVIGWPMQQKGSHAVNSHMRSKHNFREKDLEHKWQTWSLDWQRFSFLALKRFNLKLILLASFNFYILYLIISPKNPTKYKMRIFLTESHYKCSRIRNRIQLLILLVISGSEADLDKKIGIQLFTWWAETL